MQSWNLKELDLKPRLPEILSSSDSARAILLDLAENERLSDHEVHERAWLLVIDGQIEASAATGQSITGGAGTLVEFAPRERHEIRAGTNTRLLLLLTPWPGHEHPGGMTLRDKLYARRRAAKQRSQATPPQAR